MLQLWPVTASWKGERVDYRVTSASKGVVGLDIAGDEGGLTDQEPNMFDQVIGLPYWP